MEDAAEDKGLLEFAFRRGARPPVVFQFEDRMRRDAAATIARLKERGLDVHLLSGDREAAVRRVAEDLGIESAVWRASPQAKLAYVETLGKAGRKVLMVGDGINDAPALAAGFTSMAPSTASDIGRTAAETVFMGEVHPGRGNRDRGERQGAAGRQGELRPGRRLQRAGRAAGHGGSCLAAGGGHCHVDLLDHRHRQCAAAGAWRDSPRGSGKDRAETADRTANEGSSMNGLLILIPVALFLGGLGLAAFIWSLRSGQYDDLEGAAWRILQDDDKPKP